MLAITITVKHHSIRLLLYLRNFFRFFLFHAVDIPLTCFRIIILTRIFVSTVIIKGHNDDIQSAF